MNRFKEGDVVRRGVGCCPGLSWHAPWQWDGNDACPRCGTPYMLVSRRDWIDPDEWRWWRWFGWQKWADKVRRVGGSFPEDAKAVYDCTLTDGVAWTHFVHLVCQGSVVWRVETEQRYNPETRRNEYGPELVAVMLPRNDVEEFTDSPHLSARTSRLVAACREALARRAEVKR